MLNHLDGGTSVLRLVTLQNSIIKGAGYGILEKHINSSLAKHKLLHKLIPHV